MKRRLPATGCRLPARGGLALLVGTLALVTVGCFRGSPSERPPIHLNPNMDDQPKYLPQAESAFFANGMTMRPPVPGTVARGELRADEAYFLGRVGEAPVAGIPLEGGDEVMRRGEQRFGIFCGPCHGKRGDGKGMLFVRAGVESADLTSPRIVDMPSGRIYDVITTGFGLMSGYAAEVPVDDRWAIVAHVRALQGVDPAFGGSSTAEPAVAAPAMAISDEGAEAEGEGAR